MILSRATIDGAIACALERLELDRNATTFVWSDAGVWRVADVNPRRELSTDPLVVEARHNDDREAFARELREAFEPLFFGYRLGRSLVHAECLRPAMVASGRRWPSDGVKAWPPGEACAWCRHAEPPPTIECVGSNVEVPSFDDGRGFEICEDCGGKVSASPRSSTRAQLVALDPHLRRAPLVGATPPRWARHGGRVRVKSTPLMRQHGVRTTIGAGRGDDRALAGEAGVVERRIGNGWFDFEVRFDRGRTACLDASLAESLVPVRG